MNRPLRVCLVGRPNVGKSSLFNRLIGRKKALVLDTPGVTRDVSTERVQWNGVEIELADLAGLELWNESPAAGGGRSVQEAKLLQKLAVEAATQYLSNADLVLFVVDGRVPLTPADEEIARLVRRKGPKVLPVLSKIEGDVEQQAQSEVAALGWGDPLSTSAEHNLGIEELKLAALENLFTKEEFEELLNQYEAMLKERAEKARDEDAFAREEKHQGKERLGAKAKAAKAARDEAGDADDGGNGGNGDNEVDLDAIFEEAENATPLSRIGSTPERPVTMGVYGRPNVGKSTLVNALLGTKRMITSPVAGTTVDSVDSDFMRGEKFYRIVDTAGIRRRSKTEKGVEVLSVVQAMKSLPRADVALFVIDGFEGVTDQDEKVAGELAKAGRPIVVLVNKWDLCRTDRKEYAERLRESMPFLDFAPVMFVCAEKGQGLDDLFELIDEILVQRYTLAPTPELNRLVKSCQTRNNPKDAKLFFALQTSKNPPTVTIQVNDKRKVHYSFERHIRNELRSRFGWMGSPLRIVFKEKHRSR